MKLQKMESENLPLRSEDDIITVRTKSREWAENLGMDLVSQTKIVTAASELARNTIEWGGGGSVQFEMIDEGKNKGMKLTFVDEGPGIEDIELAMQDNHTSGGGLGLGLGGAKRLVNDFIIESESGKGTRVIIEKWT